MCNYHYWKHCSVHSQQLTTGEDLPKTYRSPHCEPSHQHLLTYMWFYTLNAFLEFCLYKFREQPLQGCLCTAVLFARPPKMVVTHSTHHPKALRNAKMSHNRAKGWESTVKGIAISCWKTLPYLCLQVFYLILTVTKQLSASHRKNASASNQKKLLE